MKKFFTLIVGAAIFSNAQSQKVFVSGFPQITAIDSDTKAVLSNFGENNYQTVASSSDGTKLFASNSSKSFLKIIDADTYTELDSLDTKIGDMYNIGKNNTLLSCTSNGLKSINLDDMTFDSLDIPKAFRIESRPNSNEIWVSSLGNIYIVDRTDLTFTSFSISSSEFDNGDIRFSSDGNFAYKIAAASGKIFKINAETKTKVDSITLSISSNYLEVSKDGNKLFTTRNSSKNIYIYNTSDFTLSDSIILDQIAFTIYNHPEKDELWVVHHFSDSIAVLNSNTYEGVAGFKTSGSPFFLTFAVDEMIDGIQKQVKTPDFELYPNPATSSFCVNGLKNIQSILLCNSNGVVLAYTENESVLDFSNISSGMYYAIIATPTDRFQRKVFIK